MRMFQDDSDFEDAEHSILAISAFSTPGNFKKEFFSKISK